MAAAAAAPGDPRSALPCRAFVAKYLRRDKGHGGLRNAACHLERTFPPSMVLSCTSHPSTLR